MAVEKIVDDINTVDEDLRGFYEEKDGKFHLQDISGLKNALNHTRNELKGAKTIAAKITAWEKLGKTPEEIEALIAAAAEANTKKLKDAGDFETLLGQHKSNWDKEKGTLSGQVDFWKNKYQNADRSNNLVSELTKAEATAEGLDALPTLLSDRVQYSIDGDKVSVKILSADKTTPLAGSGADGLATFADLIKEAKTKYPSLFKGNGHSGSGASDTGGKGGAHIDPKLKRSTMSTTEKAAFVKEHGQEAYLKLPM